MSRRMLTLLLLLSAVVADALAQRRPPPTFKKKSAMLLPHNATSIRENIVDTFSCESRIYGYYADMDNDCQIFHVCLPTARNAVRFSFICPAETVFNQETFVCTRNESSIPCEESGKYYKLNEAFGKVDESTENAMEHNTEYPSQKPTRPSRPSVGQQEPRPSRPTTYQTNAPDYQTTQFMQRPPNQSQNKKHKQ